MVIDNKKSSLISFESVNKNKVNNALITNSKKIIIGTANFGMVYGITNEVGVLDDNEFLKIIDLAIQNNINLIDTASSYGIAEKKLGKIIQSLEYMKIMGKYSGTKVNSWGDKMLPLEEIKISLDDLKIDAFYCYYLHSAEDLFDSNVLSEMISIKKNGLSKLIGVTVYLVKDAFAALNVPEIDVIQVKYNVLDQALDNVDFFSKAKAKNKIIYVRSVFLQGIILQKPSKIPIELKNLIDCAQDFERISLVYNVSKIYLAVFFILMNPYIDGFLIGVEKETQFEEIIKAVSIFKSNQKLYKLLKSKFGALDIAELNPSNWLKV